MMPNDRLNSVKGRWVLFTETFANWEGWPFNIWTNNDLARHFSNKRQSGANSNYPRPDGGSMLMTAIPSAMSTMTAKGTLFFIWMSLKL